MRLMLTRFLFISGLYYELISIGYEVHELNKNMPILHSRPSKSYRTKVMQHPEVMILYASGILHVK